MLTCSMVNKPSIYKDSAVPVTELDGICIPSRHDMEAWPAGLPAIVKNLLCNIVKNLCFSSCCVKPFVGSPCRDDACGTK